MGEGEWGGEGECQREYEYSAAVGIGPLMASARCHKMGGKPTASLRESEPHDSGGHFTELRGDRARDARTGSRLR